MRTSTSLLRDRARLWLTLSLASGCMATTAKPADPAPVAPALRVSLTEVGSHHTNQQVVALPPGLIDATRADSWHRTLKAQESLESLQAYQAQVEQTIKDLAQAIAEVASWLKNKDSAADSFDRQIMTDNPYFRLEAVGSLLTGELRRGRLEPPPGEPRNGRSLFAVSQVDDGIHLAVGNVDVRFPLLPDMDTEQRLQQNAIATAFASGDAAGVRFYLGRFVALAQVDIERAQQILSNVNDVLNHSESLQVSIDLINEGASAVSIHGAFQLRCQRLAGSTDSWLLEAVSSHPTASSCALAEPVAGASGPLLITVPRATTVSVLARPLQMSTASPGDATAEVRGKCVVTATTLEDEAITSSSVLVGRDLRAQWLRDKLMSGR